MASINVNCSVDDVFYRYKMPKITAKHEGKGNGVKTVLVNIGEVAKAIGRPPTYVTKYFGYELGAQTQFDNKNDRFIVNGMHEADKLQDLLNAFIKKFVLCQCCENPETDLEMATKKATSITQICKACGFNGPLCFTHKIMPFMIRNPPSIMHSSSNKGLASLSKENRRQKRTEMRSSKEAKQQSLSYPDILNRTENKQSPIKSTKSTIAKASEENEVWIADASESGVLTRMQELSAHAKSFANIAPSDSTFEHRFEKFYKIVEETMSNNGLLNNQICRRLLLEAERLDVAQKAPLALVDLLLSEEIVSEISNYKNLFIFFTYNKRGAQKYLLRGIEQLAARYPGVVIKKMPRILKICYDNDILDESVILEWAAKEPVESFVPEAITKEIRKRAAPFVNWLQEAEEETDDSEDSDCQETELLGKESQWNVALTEHSDEEDSDVIDIEAI